MPDLKKEKVYEPVGRFYLFDGSVVRMLNTERGFALAIPKSAVESGSLFLFDEEEYGIGGLGAMPERK